MRGPWTRRSQTFSADSVTNNIAPIAITKTSSTSSPIVSLKNLSSFIPETSAWLFRCATGIATQSRINQAANPNVYYVHEQLNRSTTRILIAILGACSITACSPSEAPQSATLVVKDARVWTGNAEQPWAEAVASRGDEIVAVGTNADVAAMIGEDTEVISVPGSMLVPGFIDTHVHFIASGSGLASVQLRDAATPDEFAVRLGEFARTIKPGEWIMYGDWDHTLWGGELPRRDWIDDVTPDNPVWVYRLDGHMALANSAALALAGVDADTADIEWRHNRHGTRTADRPAYSKTTR